MLPSVLTLLGFTASPATFFAEIGAPGVAFLPYGLLGGASDTGVITVPPPPPPGLGGGQSGRPGYKYTKRKRIEWLPPDYDIETGERLPAPELPVKLTKGERKVARLLAQYRSRDDTVAERAAAALEQLRRDNSSELARFIARQQAFDAARRQAAAAAAEDDDAVVAFMRWMMSQ